MNIPNILTLIRLLLVPVFVILYFSPSDQNLLYSMIIFLLAGATDVLDGYIARKYNMVTKAGIVLDPLADKLMLLTVLSCLYTSKYIPLWILLIIGVKEIFMITAGVFLYNKDVVIPSNIFGKLATCLFYIAVLVFVFNHNVGLYLLYGAVISAVTALINYLIVYLNNKNKVNKH